jgi:sugar transferase (PEP-CTERM/EpsH1 system associated)
MNSPDTARRVLYITHRVPHPPDKGDRIRNYHVLRELSKIASVWLACLADEPVTEATTQELQLLCERVEIVPVSGKVRWLRAGMSLLKGRSLSEGLFHEPALDRLLQQWMGGANFEAAIVSASSLAPYLRRNGLEKLPGVVDLVDVDSQKWYDYAEASGIPKRWLYRLEARRVRKLEQSFVSWAKAITIVSPAECAVFDSFTHPGAGTVATNGVDLETFQPVNNQPSSLACAFVGAMDYLPNVDGAIWFANDIWPGIRAKHPTAEFWIVGRKPTPAVQQLAKLPGVVVTGSVPDVRDYLARAALAVCPIRIARGLQNKVLEAMAMGKATVAAPAAVAALKVTSGHEVIVPKTVVEWIEVVSSLFTSPERCQQLGLAARQYVEEHHHWDRCLQPLTDALLAATRSGAMSSQC